MQLLVIYGIILRCCIYGFSSRNKFYSLKSVPLIYFKKEIQRLLGGYDLIDPKYRLNGNLPSLQSIKAGRLSDSWGLELTKFPVAIPIHTYTSIDQSEQGMWSLNKYWIRNHLVFIREINCYPPCQVSCDDFDYTCVPTALRSSTGRVCPRILGV